MTISSLVRIEVSPTVLVVNSVFVAVGVGLLFVDRSFVDRSVVDRGRQREGMGRRVSSVVREVVGCGLGESQNCQGHDKELRKMRNSTNSRLSLMNGGDGNCSRGKKT